MNDWKKYKKELETMISELSEDDAKIIVQLYTVLLRYLEKRGRR